MSFRAVGKTADGGNAAFASRKLAEVRDWCDALENRGGRVVSFEEFRSWSEQVEDREREKQIA